jgi:hypothetical protein
VASLNGFRFDITGASGSQGLLTPKSSWRAYIFPRGAYAEQDSTGTLITVDSADVASRFAANDWIQVGISTDNIRQVAAVGGNSFSVNSAVTVSENDRVFLIGTTQPTVTGGSATYTVPESVIRERDDDAADIITNSMITSNANGLIQGFAATNFYDVLIQDGDQSNQGFIADMEVGAVGGISATGAALFGTTATFNGQIGVTGWATFGASVTMNAQLGVTGHATFGSSVTGHANAGFTGQLAVGGSASVTDMLIVGTTLTVDGALGVTDLATIGTTLTVDGNLGVTGSGLFGATVTASAGASFGSSLSLTEFHIMGASAARVTGIIGTSLTNDPANIGTQGWTSQEVTVVGAALGDFALASFSLDVQDLTVTADVTAADTVTVTFNNNTSGAINLTEGSIKVLVIKAGAP